MARSIDLGGGQMNLHPQLFKGDQPEDVLGAHGRLMTAFYQMVHPGTTHRLVPLGEGAGRNEADADQITEYSLVRTYFVAAMHDMLRPSRDLDFQPVILTAVDEDVPDALLHYLSVMGRQPIVPVPPIAAANDIQIMNANGVRLAGAIATLRPATESDARSPLTIDQDVLVVPRVLDEQRPGIDTTRIAENSTAALIGASVARAVMKLYNSGITE